MGHKHGTRGAAVYPLARHSPRDVLIVAHAMDAAGRKRRRPATKEGGVRREGNTQEEKTPE